MNLLLAACLLIEVSSLSKFVKQFHPLQYDSIQVESAHKLIRQDFSRRRKRRSHDKGPTVEIDFTVQKKNFVLVLHGDSSAFDDDLEVEDSSGHSLKHSLSHLVTGKIKDQPGSIVDGSIKNGIFSGTIFSPQWGTYYAENQKNLEGVTHSIIYHENDIEMPNSQCIEMRHAPANESDGKIHFTQHDSDIYNHPMDYYWGSNDASDESMSANNSEKKRTKREVTDETEEEKENTCILLIHVDHMFVSDPKFQKCSSGLQKTCEVDRDEIISFIQSHVKAINNIYIRSPFIVKKGGRDVKIRPRFQVKRVKIDESSNEMDPFRSKNIGVEKFLEKASLGNFDDYCLAYVFTKRDFQNGVLGLAWVAQPEGNSGGICEKNKKYTDGISKSLNTGIITIENYNSIVPEKVSHITFAHEIGHNFGSPHDDISCSPGESSDPAKKSKGNYIMYSRATAGDRFNNDKFSSCSIGNITQVLQRKRKCFVSSDAPICGNQIVDGGEEECDCGFKEDCDALGDKCCYPADYEQKSKRCKRKTNPSTRKKYACSPSEGPCCKAETCSFRGMETICSSELDCTFEQACNGSSPKCPKPKSKQDNTWCHKETMVCKDGQCSQSACNFHAGTLEPCECEVDETKASEEEMKKNCHVCCQRKGKPETCTSTGELTSYFGRKDENGILTNRTIFRQPGSPCNNYEGYCDVFSKCRSVDADGPLARLKKALFNPVLYSSIREWIIEYWWAVLLMALALVMLMGAFIKICSIHTASDNPNLPEARDFPGTGTLRRFQSGRHQNRRNQYQNQVPLSQYEG